MIDRASELLGLDMKALCFEENDLLDQTEYTQAALVTVCMAMEKVDVYKRQIIGGVSMTGGVGSITGTLFGVFVICLLKTGLPFIGLTANWQQIITGFVLIAAVLVDILKRKAGKE